jgi:hypothetical protein
LQNRCHLVHFIVRHSIECISSGVGTRAGLHLGTKRKGGRKGRRVEEEEEMTRKTLKGKQLRYRKKGGRKAETEGGRRGYSGCEKEWRGCRKKRDAVQIKYFAPPSLQVIVQLRLST